MSGGMKCRAERKANKQANNKPGGLNAQRLQHMLVGAAPAGRRCSGVGHSRLKRKGESRRRDEGRREEGLASSWKQHSWVELG